MKAPQNPLSTHSSAGVCVAAMMLRMMAAPAVMLLLLLIFCLLTTLSTTAAIPAPTAAECLAYLRKYMPAVDARSPNITDGFLRQNVELALAARAATPWAASVPTPIFLNDVLPYSILGEPRGLPDWNWRPLFHQQLAPRLQAATPPNMSAAAEWVNSASWSVVGAAPAITFVGSPNCQINSYSPLQTIQRHNSSCTGLAIYLVAALRAVGIPARVAGTPHWNRCGGRGKTCKTCPHGDTCTPGDHSSDDSCGNHDWAEAWLDGGWHFLDPDGSKQLDGGWFVANTQLQTEHVGDYLNHSVIASSYAPTATLPPALYPDSSPISHFPMVWDWENVAVGGWDVTARYHKQKAPP
eukprot:COSAG01_NODE_5118_length_4473_cov_3.194559_2_plen_353_part_00